MEVKFILIVAALLVTQCAISMNLPQKRPAAFDSEEDEAANDEKQPSIQFDGELPEFLKLAISEQNAKTKKNALRWAPQSEFEYFSHLEPEPSTVNADDILKDIYYSSSSSEDESEAARIKYRKSLNKAKASKRRKYCEEKTQLVFQNAATKTLPKDEIEGVHGFVETIYRKFLDLSKTQWGITRMMTDICITIWDDTIEGIDEVEEWVSSFNRSMGDYEMGVADTLVNTHFKRLDPKWSPKKRVLLEQLMFERHQKARTYHVDFEEYYKDYAIGLARFVERPGEPMDGKPDYFYEKFMAVHNIVHDLQKALGKEIPIYIQKKVDEVIRRLGNSSYVLPSLGRTLNEDEIMFVRRVSKMARNVSEDIRKEIDRKLIQNQRWTWQYFTVDQAMNDFIGKLMHELFKQSYPEWYKKDRAKPHVQRILDRFEKEDGGKLDLKLVMTIAPRRFNKNELLRLLARKLSVEFVEELVDVVIEVNRPGGLDDKIRHVLKNVERKRMYAGWAQEAIEALEAAL